MGNSASIKSYKAEFIENKPEFIKMLEPEKKYENTTRVYFVLENIGNEDIKVISLNLPRENLLQLKIWKTSPPDSQSIVKLLSEIPNVDVKGTELLGDNTWKKGEYVFLNAIYDAPKSGEISKESEIIFYPETTSPATTSPETTSPATTSPETTFPATTHPVVASAIEAKSNHTVLIIGASIGLILAIIVGIYFYRRNKN